ncbi:MAG: hypothetical protein M0Z94_10945 [Dehalococcoidales bacterium]|nr:hypothetical protein [Dehalococcoidales bacterium]
MAISTGKVSKNQTAAERAAAAEATSGKMCAKCNTEIRLKDLINVKTVDHGTGKKITVAYHRKCYGF